MALGAPRKTLDEIRREVDAEFAGTPIADAAAGEAGAKRYSPRRDVVKYDVDDELRRDRRAERVDQLDRIAVVEVGDARRGRLVVVGRVEAHGRREAGRAHEAARLLVIGEVVGGREREHDVGIDGAHERSRAAQQLVQHLEDRPRP